MTTTEQPRRRRRSTITRGERPAVEAAPAQEQAAETIDEAPKVSERKPLRSEMRGNDLDRAKVRAAEILGDDDMLTESEDKFYIDKNTIPDGWTYEWKRDTVYGKGDPQYRTELMRGGWEPVPTKRHPEHMPPGTPDEYIHREGLILMERPAEITERVRNREALKARHQMRAKEEQLRSAPPGTFERGTHPGAPVKINRSYSPAEIPRD